MGIPIVYFRSSSFNCHRMCPMKYYTEYTLGWRGKSGKKADKGTMCHKVLEIAALAKKAAQDGADTIEDPDIGTVETNNYEPEYLDEITDRVYKYYTEGTPTISGSRETKRTSISGYGKFLTIMTECLIPKTGT